jgi:hypothetical protein
VFAGKKCGRLALALSLALLIVAEDAVAVGNCDEGFVACVCSSNPNAYIAFASEPGWLDGTFDSQLSRIGKELLKPPASPASDVNIKSLPGVPATLFMVLTGFLCVSFVHDRRVWLAALTGLLWLGQAGLSAIPELALHIASKRQIKQQCPGNVTGAHRDKHSRRTRSNIEGTQYVCLLRHLAGIPDVIVSYSAVVLHPSLRVSYSGSGALRTSAVRAHLAPPEFALLRLASDTIKSTSCPACAAEQPVCFSPAFIFSNLARGPPKSA